MTEKVLFNYTDGFTGGVGDGSAPYTEEEFRSYNDAFLNGEAADAGVIAGIDNELEVTVTVVPPDTIQVNTGRAIVHGFPYYNDASVDLGAPSGSGDRAGYVIIRMNRTSANSPPNEDEGRLRFLMSATTTLPSFTQDSATTWDIPLASFYVEGATGSIFKEAAFTNPGVNDLRTFCTTPLSRTKLIGSQVVSGSTSLITFDNIPPTFTHLRLVMNVKSDDAGTAATLGVSFNNKLTGHDTIQAIITHPSSLVTAETLNASSVNLTVIASGGSVPNTSSYIIFEIPFYSNTVFNKSGEAANSLQTASTTGNVDKRSCTWYWRFTEAISEIDVGIGPGNFVVGSQVFLYGIS